MTSKRYKTAPAFKAALEHRLRRDQSEGRDLQRRRQLVIFDRFLARIADEFDDAVVLKGGLVLEVRLARARTTKDVDLRVTGDTTELLARLQRAGRIDTGDFMTFEVRRHRRPTISGPAVRYDGVRFQVECKLANKPFGEFGVDIGIGDPMVGEPELVLAKDRLAFAGIEPPRLRLYPVVTHLAEKLHAYTMPRERPNSRVKDLPDIALLACTGPLESARLREALEKTFDFRGTHDVPGSLPNPPGFWAEPYAKMARDFDLPWRTLDECHDQACKFLDPVLAAEPVRRWCVERWEWLDAEL